MTFIEFIWLCFIVTVSVSKGRKYIDKHYPEHNQESRNKSLRAMFEDGDLASDVPIRYQIQAMSASDLDGNPIDIDEDMDIVDIVAAKKKLQLKNDRLSGEIVLDVA